MNSINKNYKKNYKKYKKLNKNQRYLIISGTILLILSVSLIIIRTFSGFNYKIVDYFYETTGNQKFVFMFAEVNHINHNDIESASKEIMQNHIVLKNKDDAERLGIIIYFYKNSDMELVPKRMLGSLKRKFQDKNVEDNLRYVANGMIYMKFTSKNNLSLDKDTLIKSDIIIPRPGVRAKDVMKRGKR